MKKTVIFTLTLLFAMTTLSLTTATAQQYVQVDTLTNHTQHLNAVGFAPKFYITFTLFAASNDYVYFWDGRTFDYKGRYTLPSGADGRSVAHRTGYYRIAVGVSGISEVVVLDPRSRTREGRYDSPGSEYPISVAYSPDGSKLAAGTDENVILIWQCSNRRHLRTLRGHTGDVYSVAWSADGRRLASASEDGTVRVWNPNNGINSIIFRGHTDKVYSVAWSPDGQKLASGSEDGSVRIWDVNTQRFLRRVTSISNRAAGVAWHPDGHTLAAIGGDSNFRLINTNTWNITGLRAGNAGGGHRYRSIAWNPSGSKFVGNPVMFGRTDSLFVYSLLDVDVTGNGVVNINDLVEVARNYGKTVAGGANRRADVDKDGRVDIEDLTIVAKAINSAFAAPAFAKQLPAFPFTAAEVKQWIQDAKAMGVDVEGIAVLEQLLAVLMQVKQSPKETVLLANYPNPFNPETWIPYQLAKPTEVTVSIHSADGQLVRTLELGQLPAGVYQEKDRAAYWDGKNEQGESVASGVYFYTLKAGDFSATKKMLIRK